MLLSKAGIEGVGQLMGKGAEREQKFWLTRYRTKKQSTEKYYYADIESLKEFILTVK